MMRSEVLTAVLLGIVFSMFPGNACATDSRSLDDQVRWEGGLYSPFSGSWCYADVQAKQIDRLLVVLTQIREGRQSEAIRLLEEDLLNEKKSFDSNMADLEKGMLPLSDWDRTARDHVREVSKKLREYEQNYMPVKQQGQPAKKSVQTER